MLALWQGHEFVCGLPGSGKTHHAVHVARQHRGPLLVIDPQDDPQLPWPRADSGNTWGQVWQAAAHGGVRYVPSMDDARANRELQLMASRLLLPHDREWLIVIDEAHIYAPEGRPAGPLHQLARRGRRFNGRLLLISQRPADLSKGLVLLAARHTIFTTFEGAYLSRYGIPGDELRQRLVNGGDYSYCTWDMATLQGPFRDPP